MAAAAVPCFSPPLGRDSQSHGCRIVEGEGEEEEEEEGRQQVENGQQRCTELEDWDGTDVTWVSRAA